MSTTDQPQTLTDLLGGLVSDVSGLFRKEIELAKTEATEKVEQVAQASQGLLIGGVLAIGAVGVFLAALVTGVTVLLVSMGMGAVLASCVASLAVAVVVGAVAWTFIQGAMAQLKASNLNLNRTTRSLARDAAAVKESF